MTQDLIFASHYITNSLNQESRKLQSPIGGVDDPEQHPTKTPRILVHCHQGINRSATAVAYYILDSNPEADVFSTLRHMFSLRPFMLTNKTFRRTLASFAVSRNQAPIDCNPAQPFLKILDDFLNLNPKSTPTPGERTQITKVVIERAIEDSNVSGEFVLPCGADKSKSQRAWSELAKAMNQGQLFDCSVEQRSTGASGTFICVKVTDIRQYSNLRDLSQVLTRMKLGFSGKVVPSILYQLGVHRQESPFFGYLNGPAVACLLDPELNETAGAEWLQQTLPDQQQARRRLQK
eukprot:c18778_g1_i1.p1 GENE.c18778_g1_i1~~c18778_g1_i1.p1  ORF type:complete len:292 (+),score=72.01 c18778_g1_i1:436-1311(+)